MFVGFSLPGHSLYNSQQELYFAFAIFFCDYLVCKQNFRMLLLLCVVLFLFLYVQHRYMLKKPLKLCGLLQVFKLWWLHHKKLATSFHFPIPYYILVSCIFHLFGSHTIVVEFWAWLPFIQRWLYNFDKAFRYFPYDGVPMVWTTNLME